MKICSKCKQSKLEAEFNKNKNKADGLNTFCRVCHNAHSKGYYQTHQAKMTSQNRANNKLTRSKRHIQMLEFLATKVCKDCNTPDTRVLEFDHLPEYEKTMDVGRMLCSGWSWKRVLQEIAKCDIVCANCHRIRTYERSNSYRIMDRKL